MREERTITHEDGTKETIPAVKRVASNALINRELAILSKMIARAVQLGKLLVKPKFQKLKEDNRRKGFFDGAQIAAVLRHLPSEIQPVIEFAYITGWRITSEVLPLEWRQVDFAAGEVRLDPGMTKTGEPRVFPFTDELRTVLEAQRREHERLKQAGHICAKVFFREVAQGRGGPVKPMPILSFNKAWKTACTKAGCPGRIPHDLRRSAIRNFVRNGISQSVAMSLSGHKTDSVFKRYEIVDEADLRDAAKKMNANRYGSVTVAAV